MSEPTATQGRRKGIGWAYFIPVIALAILAVFFYRGMQLNPTFIESPLIGTKAAEFSLPGLRDPAANVSTADMAGRYALLNVWATWCTGCRQEHAFLVELSRSGMPIYGLNWKDDRMAAIEWLERLGDPYVVSAADVVGDVAIDYGVYAAPETFLLAPDLTILHKHFGPLDGTIWQRDFVPTIEAHQAGG